MRRLIAIALLATVAACVQQSPGEAPAAADQAEISRTDTLAISLRNDGSVLLGGDEMTADELGNRLGDMDPLPTLTVRVDTEVSYGRVEDFLKDLREREVLVSGQVAGVTFVHETRN